MNGYSKYPDWKNLVHGYDSFTSQQFIEVPIIQDLNNFYYLSDRDTSQTDTAFLNKSKNKRSLIILKNADNSYYIAICNIIPDSKFFTVGGRLFENNYISKSNNFSGIVVYTDWDDNILEAYDFENGVCMGEVRFGMEDEYPDSTNLNIRWTICGVRKICEYYCDCPPSLKDLTERNYDCNPSCTAVEIYCDYILVHCPVPLGDRGGYKGGSGDTGGTGGGTSGGGGGVSGNGNQRTPVQNVSEFEMECGDVNALDEHESETYACHDISKGDLAKFKMCMIEALIAKGVEVNENCRKSYFKDKFELTDEELEIMENIFENGFNIDKNPLYKLNRCEWDKLVNFPKCAIDVFKAIERATNMTVLKWGISDVKDCSDAFRHAFWMALITRASNCGSSLALTFGIAHECDLPDGANDKVMDLFNNSFGINLALNNPGLNEDELANLLCNYLYSGDLRILAEPKTPNEHIVSSVNCTCR